MINYINFDVIYAKLVFIGLTLGPWLIIQIKLQGSVHYNGAILRDAFWIVQNCSRLYDFFVFRLSSIFFDEKVCSEEIRFLKSIKSLLTFFTGLMNSTSANLNLSSPQALWFFTLEYDFWSWLHPEYISALSIGQGAEERILECGGVCIDPDPGPVLWMGHFCAVNCEVSLVMRRVWVASSAKKKLVVNMRFLIEFQRWL